MHDLSHIYFCGADSPPPLHNRGSWRTAPVEAAHRRLRPEGDAVKLDPFMAWMLEQAGLPAEAYRAKAIQRRLPACLRQLRVATPASARALLEKKRELLRYMLNSTLIGVTGFFRDRAVFDALRTEGLPELLRSRAGLRVYSVGASEGQELYSIAILLAEVGVLEQSELLGIDCRPDATARARGGSYAVAELAGVSEARRTRYFSREGSRWVVRPELRARATWRTADLFSAADDAKWDMILFRNVAIYLDEKHAAPVWERLAAQLNPGGILVTGKAEKPSASLPLVRLAPSLYRKSA